MSTTPQPKGDNKTALVISNFFNERYGNIQSLSQKLKAECRKRSLGQPSLSHAPATAYSKRRRSRSYCRYHQSRPAPRVSVSKAISFSSSGQRSSVSEPRKCSTHRQLVTHKWHAKRFHMTKQWGCVLPRAHMHRGRRFLWSALKAQCLIHDQSYLVPVVLRVREAKPEAEIGSMFSLLAKLMDPLQAEECTNFFRAQRFNTLHEQQICLYRNDSFPRHCLGPATVFLTPVAEEKQQRQLWLWVHPAMAKDVLEALHRGREQLLKPGATILDISTSTNISLLSAGSATARFGRISVIGTGASQLLRRVIRPLLSPDTDKTNAENGNFFDQVLQSEGINSLWKHNEGLSFEALDCRELLFKEKGRTEIREENPYQTWTSLAPSQPHTRRQHQKKRMLSSPSSPVTSEFFSKSYSTVKVPDSVLNAMRQQQREEVYQLSADTAGNISTHSVVTKDTGSMDKWSFVSSPATSRAEQQSQDNGNDEEVLRSNLKFPILIIRKCQQAEHIEEGGADCGLLPLCLRGWDLLVPEQHCSSVWLALNYAGGRSIGLEERAAVQGAMPGGGATFPCDFPDSAAGREHWKLWRRSNHLQNRKRPVKKQKQNKYQERVPNLKKLFDNENGDRAGSKVTDLVVMRNVEFARPFFPSQLLQTTKHGRDDGHASATSLKCNASFELDIADTHCPVFPFPTLIRVHISASGRGVPQCGAELFQPSLEDYDQWLLHRSHRNDATTTPNRKLGDWNGISDIAYSATRGGERGQGRALVGVVSSALQPDLFRSEKSATAFCEAGKLSQMVAFSTSLISRGKGASILPLIMYRNPLTDIMRPALFQLSFH